jgi:hypothetical protein
MLYSAFSSKGGPVIHPFGDLNRFIRVTGERPKARGYDIPYRMVYNSREE